MGRDKYSAVWVSYSSISDFLKCPRAYFLKNVYRDPETGNKIALMQPPLALGQVVHEVLESLSVLPVEKRFDRPLEEKFEIAWKRVGGDLGGFADKRTENKYKQRGLTMLSRVKNYPGPIAKKAVKIKEELPYFWLDEEENIILCGKIDWLEYLPETDGVHIVDFKTGERKEKDDSLQLPIYFLLANKCQHRPVQAASYWYLETDNELTGCKLPDKDEAWGRVLKIAKKIKLARQFEKFSCPTGGCFACKPLERIVIGEAKLVGVNNINQNVYILVNKDTLMESEIL